MPRPREASNPVQSTNLKRMPQPKATRRASKLTLVDPQVEKIYYRRVEAAYALGLPLRSIDYMIADRRLSTRRYGRDVLIPVADIKRVAAEIMQSDMLHGNTGQSRITVSYVRERNEDFPA